MAEGERQKDAEDSPRQQANKGVVVTPPRCCWMSRLGEEGIEFWMGLQRASRMVELLRMNGVIVGRRLRGGSRGWGIYRGRWLCWWWSWWWWLLFVVRVSISHGPCLSGMSRCLWLALCSCLAASRKVGSCEFLFRQKENVHLDISGRNSLGGWSGIQAIIRYRLSTLRWRYHHTQICM